MEANMQAQAAYDELLRRNREASLLASCTELLGWDELTFMPAAGAAYRAEQLALMAGLQHDRATDPRLGELLAIVEDSDLVADSDSVSAANIRELRRFCDRQASLPRALVEETARVTSLAQQEWAAARQDDDFARFLPWLERVIALRCQEAATSSIADPYDALLDEYEPGARRADLDQIFGELQRELTPLLGVLDRSPRQPDGTVLRREFPVERQRLFGEMAAAAVGFDFHAGRLDTTVHPFFSAIGPGDCRITCRFDTRDFREGFFGILHETGHGLYEQGLTPEHHGTPVGEVPSLGWHESQARLWENTVGRGRPFWRHFFPLARSLFPATLHDITPEDFHFAINQVQRSLCRVGADEVTYNLHILMRFELEQALISGQLRSADLPAAWNEASRRYLGVVPANDADGCLQDGHWASGLIGYFPTYALGNLIAAQLFARAEHDLGSLDGAFAHGDFTGLLGWLRERVYRQGSRYSASRLLEITTGAPLSHRPLMQALRRKYGELYGI
jgi:carboxypeptidase Taq